MQLQAIESVISDVSTELGEEVMVAVSRAPADNLAGRLRALAEKMKIPGARLRVAGT
jgi:hypothetical protein